MAVVTLCAMASANAADPELIKRLSATKALNMTAILDAQFDGGNATARAPVTDPYLAENHQAILASMNDSGDAVCAVKFTAPEQIEYRLETFDSAREAADLGYTLTHYGRCGSCSTLRDLAIYLERTDLTTPARRCARKWGFNRVQRCFESEIGFTADCAASWAYNALNTRQNCRGACIETYGLLNLLLHRYPVPNNREDGSLNACLQCDEDISGPGFRYSAGRTRRNSGITSAIGRADGELREVDHGLYFSGPGIEDHR